MKMMEEEKIKRNRQEIKKGFTTAFKTISVIMPSFFVVIIIFLFTTSTTFALIGCSGERKTENKNQSLARKNEEKTHGTHSHGNAKKHSKTEHATEKSKKHGKEKHGEKGHSMEEHGMGEHSTAGTPEKHTHPDEHGDTPEYIPVSDEWMREFGISVSTAKKGVIVKEVSLPGEVKIPVDKIAHVVAPVSGIIVKTYKGIGDKVKKGEILAVLRSRELAMLKSDYLIALEKYKIAKQNWEREKKLWEKGISPQSEYLDAKREWETARITLKSAEHKLLSVGLTPDEIKKIPEEKDIAVYMIKSPKNGVVVEKHAVEGEFKNTGDTLFKIINTSLIWIDFSVWQEYLPWIWEGQKVRITYGDMELEGKIIWVSPTLDPKTRTATARVELKNDGKLKPSAFVMGKLKLMMPVEIAVPSESVVRIKDDYFVFVEDGKGRFIPRKVVVGIEGEKMVEIKKGLHEGEKYVSKGAFFLKSEILKEEFSGEGHAH